MKKIYLLTISITIITILIAVAGFFIIKQNMSARQTNNTSTNDIAKKQIEDTKLKTDVVESREDVENTVEQEDTHKEELAEKTKNTQNQNTPKNTNNSTVAKNTNISSNNSATSSQSQIVVKNQAKQEPRPKTNTENQTQVAETNKTTETKNKTQPQNTTQENKSVTCTNNNNHIISVGNTGKWFTTQNEAIAYFDSQLSYWGKKWEKDEIDDDTYDKNCPYRYELYQCSCGKWTINFYYRK